MYNINWERLLDNIEDRQCVLIIGPELLDVNGIPLNTAVHQELLKQDETDQTGYITHYYQRDGLFSFRDTSKVRVASRVKRIYKMLSPDLTPLEKIAEIPFPLIVSVSPDNYLSDILLRRSQPHYFGYFHLRNGQQRELPTPDSSNPVLYNLTGNCDDDFSLVLDYEDLFQLLKSSIGGYPGLPMMLGGTLNMAVSYILLGCQIDRWYTQLLLRLLSENRGVSKIAQAFIPDVETRTFLSQHLEITLVGHEIEFLSELHKRCQGRTGCIRQFHTSYAEEVIPVLRHLQSDNIAAALTTLHELRAPQIETELTLISSRFFEIQRRKEQKTLFAEQDSVLTSQIRVAIIEMCKTLSIQ